MIEVEGRFSMLKRLWTYSTELWETLILLVMGIVILVALQPQSWVAQLFAAILGGMLIILCVANFFEWTRSRAED